MYTERKRKTGVFFPICYPFCPERIDEIWKYPLSFFLCLHLNICLSAFSVPISVSVYLTPYISLFLSLFKSKECFVRAFKRSESHSSKLLEFAKSISSKIIQYIDWTSNLTPNHATSIFTICTLELVCRNKIYLI